MATINEREKFLACHFLLRTVLQRRMAREERRKYRFCDRAIFLRREELGMYHTLVQKLQINECFCILTLCLFSGHVQFIRQFGQAVFSDWSILVIRGTRSVN